MLYEKGVKVEPKTVEDVRKDIKGENEMKSNKEKKTGTDA
jgi:hypothetical protein